MYIDDRHVSRSGTLPNLGGPRCDAACSNAACSSYDEPMDKAGYRRSHELLPSVVRDFAACAREERIYAQPSASRQTFAERKDKSYQQYNHYQEPSWEKNWDAVTPARHSRKSAQEHEAYGHVDLSEISVYHMLRKFTGESLQRTKDCA